MTEAISLSRGNKLEFSNPLIMGVVNCTPDSFAVRYESSDDAITSARRLIDEGADILDIGGESSRPGSEPVSEAIELERVLPVIEAIRPLSDIPISIDTTKAAVAEKALTAGADMINDISALSFDPKMAFLAAQSGCPVILMHIKGRPKTMQDNPYYDDVLGEVYDYFRERIMYAVSQGIAEDKIIVDVGIGFGKRTVDNLKLIRRLGHFRTLGRPVMVGASRKRFIGDIAGAEVEDRLPGSLGVATLTAFLGADIIRVHDVAQTKQAVALAMALREA